MAASDAAWVMASNLEPNIHGTSTGAPRPERAPEGERVRKGPTARGPPKPDRNPSGPGGEKVPGELQDRTPVRISSLRRGHANSLYS